MTFYIVALTPLSSVYIYICIYIYIYIYIFLVLCIMVAGFIFKGCSKCFLALGTLLRTVDSWLGLGSKRDFTKYRCHSVEIMYFSYFFFLVPKSFRDAIVGKSIYTWFVVKVCLTYRCSFLKLSFWIWFIVGSVSSSVLISILL